MRLIDFFDRGAALYPQRTCMTDERRSLSFRDVRTLTHRIGSGLIGSALAPQ